MYNELNHSGVPGQKWGVRNAEWYPISAWKAHLRKEGRATVNKKTTGELSDRKRKKIAKKVAKQRTANLQKAREAKARAIESRKEKEDIIRTGDIERAIKRIDDFSNEELNIIRARNQAKIDITQAKTDAIISKMGTIADVTQKVSNITTNGVNIYNNIAKIANAFGDTNLPILGANNNQQQKSNNNQNQNQNNSKAQEQSDKDKQKEQEKLNKKIDKDIEKRIKDIDKAAKKNAEKAAKEAEKNKEPEHYSGEVEGEPFTREEYKEAAKAVKDIVVDTVWKDITDVNVRKGQEYVTKALPQMNYPLLEMKKK